MKTGRKKPPPRLREREGESRLTGEKIIPRARESKPFDAVERKLSLTLDALLDAIETYREANR